MRLARRTRKLSLLDPCDRYFRAPRRPESPREVETLSGPVATVVTLGSGRVSQSGVRRGRECERTRDQLERPAVRSRVERSARVSEEVQALARRGVDRLIVEVRCIAHGAQRTEAPLADLSDFGPPLTLPPVKARLMHECGEVFEL